MTDMEFYILILIVAISCTKSYNKNQVSHERLEIHGGSSATERRISLEGREIKVKYKFSSPYPSMVKITKEHIFLGNTQKIYCFNKNGDFISEILPPKQFNEFIAFEVFENKSGLRFYTVFDNELVSFDANGNLIFQISEVGDNIKVDDDGNIYTFLQAYNETSGELDNIIKKISFKGTVTNSIELNCGTVNLEIVKNKLMFHCSDSKFYEIPLDSLTQIMSHPLKDLDGNVYYLGKVNDFNIFKTFDYKSKKDVIHCVNSEFIEVKTVKINQSYKDVIEEQRTNEDYLVNNPSGNTFCYYDNQVYYFRNVNKGTYLYQIEIE